MGCSFIYSRPPASSPAEGAAAASTSNSRSRKGCGDYINPLYDLTWVAGGLGWVLTANRLEDRSRPRTYVATADGLSGSSGAATKDYQWLRDVGYGQMAFFGASTLWGLYVEMRCAEARKALLGESAAEKAKARNKGAFPNVVLGFTLGMPAAQAESACRAQPGEYVADDAGATCTSHPQAPAAANHVRLRFSLGALSEVIVFDTPPANQLGKAYDELYATLNTKYGAPQIDRSPLPNACQSGLEACLEQGVTVKGAKWFWPKGSVSLTPIWHAEHAEIDVRYAPEDGGD